MPARSKFTAARRELIVTAIACGASRRTASKIAGVDHATVQKWLKRGERVPEGRFGEFRRRVLEGESDPHRRRLLPVPEPEPDVSAAWKFIERREFFPELAGVEFRVIFSDGTPV
jgi:transposase